MSAAGGLVPLAVLPLAALFLAFRGADVGQLPAVLPAWLLGLVRVKVVGAGSAASLAGAIIAALIGLAWYGLGATVASRLGGSNDPRPLAVARTYAIGAALWSVVWFGLGLIGLYRTEVGVAALLTGLALAAWRWRAEGTTARPDQDGESAARLAWSLVVLPVALALLAALAPPTAKDALIYHVALPKAFVLAGGLAGDPYNIASYYALGAEMHGVWALLLGRLVSEAAAEAAFGGVSFAFLPLLLAVVLGWARSRGVGPASAVTATALVATVPTIYHVTASRYVDIALALYVTLAVHAISRWWTTGRDQHLVHLALATGGALAVKVLALFAVVPVTVVVLLRAFRGGPASGRALARGGLALAAGVALASPWYLRTWARSGSPLFPFFPGVWPGTAPGWDDRQNRMLDQMNALYGGNEGPFDYLAAPLRLSFTAQPELPSHYDGVLGVSFLLGLIVLALGLARRVLDTEAKIAAGAAGIWFFLWLGTSQQLRYLVPPLPLLAVAIVQAGAALGGGRWLRRGLLASTIVGALVILAWFVQTDPLRVVLGGEPRTAYLARRLDHFPHYQFINATLPSDARVWLVYTRRDTYHLERPWFADFMFDDHALRHYLEGARDVAEVRRRVRAAGITHVFARHDILFDEGRSPFVDPHRPPAERRADLERLRAFLLHGTRVLRADGKFVLVDLAPSPGGPAQGG